MAEKKLSGGMKMLIFMGGTAAIVIGYAAYSLFFKSQDLPQASSQVAPSSLPREKFVPEPGKPLPQAYEHRIVTSDEQRAQQARKTGESYLPVPVAAGGVSQEEYDRVRTELEKAKAKNEEMSKELDNLKRQMQALQGQRKDAAADILYYHQGKTLLVDKKLQSDRISAVSQQIADLGKTVGAPKPLVVAAQLEKPEKGQNDAQKAENSQAGKGGQDEKNTLVARVQKALSAGTILYATLDVTANSDAPGPIVATLQDGPDDLMGAKLVGSFTKANDFLVIQFNQVVLPRTKERVPIRAYAVDPALRQVSVVDEVDNHVLTKLAATFGAAWMQGIGEAYMQSGTITPIYGSQGDGVIKESSLNGGEVALAGLGRVGEALGRMLEPYANRPSTVIKYADTPIGVLFL